MLKIPDVFATRATLGQITRRGIQWTRSDQPFLKRIPTSEDFYKREFSDPRKNTSFLKIVI